MRNHGQLVDTIIVGAGAAGLATAIFARRTRPEASLVLLESAKKPGAKILVSGGARCNVTNRIVSETDFWGGRRVLIKRVLHAFSADDAMRFFAELKVPLHEEADGKLFPDSNRSRDVLDALLNATSSSGASLHLDHRVTGIRVTEGRFQVHTTRATFIARRVVLATGGQSLPRSGSDGAGYEFARRLGHRIVPTTPALAPLVLGRVANDRAPAGVSQDVELSVRVDGRVAIRLNGSMLWTHFGISGPVVLNASRHWLRAALHGQDVSITANFCPGDSFERVDERWTTATHARPKSSVLTVLGLFVPASVGAMIVERLHLDSERHLAHLTRTERRALVHALVEWPLAVQGSRGYTFAEATAGGVALDEVDLATMESRICRGLYLVGEILDVDGRIGGFNFQWAWSTGFVAGTALGRSD